MPAAPESAPAAVGLDLGSSYVKAGVLGASGRLERMEREPAPALRGESLVREGDPLAYVDAANRALARVAARFTDGTPVGLASQRSSFVVWERDGGEPVTPLVSWQDRRAADWCRRHARHGPEVTRRTGLPLSAHYAGPKLATLQEADPRLAAGLRSGGLLFGTLDSFLLWRWSGGRLHRTDPTVASRTLLFDLDSGDWSPALLRLFGVPRQALPEIGASCGDSFPVAGGLRLSAALADQTAGVLASIDPARGGALVNLGTGGFVLVPTAERERREGYLCSPLAGRPGTAGTNFALEGAVNGCGPAMRRFGSEIRELPERDPAPDAFALPDMAGLGSPYWRPEIGLEMSGATPSAGADARGRAVMEGLIFRVAGILDDLAEVRGERAPVRLGGGLSREPAIARGLASLLQREVEVIAEPNVALLAVCRLAGGLEAFANPRVEPVAPSRSGAYLRNKYPRWRRWLEGLLAVDGDG